MIAADYVAYQFLYLFILYVLAYRLLQKFVRHTWKIFQDIAFEKISVPAVLSDVVFEHSLKSVHCKMRAFPLLTGAIVNYRVPQKIRSKHIVTNDVLHHPVCIRQRLNFSFLGFFDYKTVVSVDFILAAQQI